MAHCVSIRFLVALAATLLTTAISRAQLIDSYDADSLSLGSLASWTDLTGTQNATVAGANAEVDPLSPIGDPTVANTDAAFNGHQYVSFGSASGLATASGLFSGSSPRSIVAVYDDPLGNNAATNPIAGEASIGIAGTWFILQSRSTPPGDPYLAGFADDLTTNSTSLPSTQLTFAIATYNGTQETLYYAYGMGAVQTATPTTVSLNTTSVPFGIGFDPSEYASGNMNIGQVDVYGSSLSGPEATAEIEALQDYYAIPEPSAFALLGVSLLGGLVFLRRPSPGLSQPQLSATIPCQL